MAASALHCPQKYISHSQQKEFCFFVLQESSYGQGIDLSDRLILNVGWRLKQVSTEQKPLKVVAISVRS